MKHIPNQHANSKKLLTCVCVLCVCNIVHNAMQKVPITALVNLQTFITAVY